MLTLTPWYTQTVAGLAVVLVMYIVSVGVIQGKQNALTSVFQATNKPVWIAKGVVDARSLVMQEFDTNNPAATNYLFLPASVNRFGGAQMCYSFWMKLTNVDDANVAGKPILTRGSMTDAYLSKKLTNPPINSAGNPVNPELLVQQSSPRIKAPCIRFGSSYRELVVECNTTMAIEKSFSTLANRQDTKMSNVIDMIPGRWVMYTVVLEDNMPFDEWENGILLRVYLNDTLYHREYTRGALRLNKGNLFLMPAVIQGAFIADMRYLPWAPTDQEVSKMYAKGISPGSGTCAKAAKANMDAPLVIPDN